MNNEEANIEQIQDNTAEISSVELNAETPVEETQQQEFFPVAEVAPEVEIPTPEPEPVPEPVLEVVTPVAIPDEKVADEPVPVIPVEVEQPKEEPIIVETPKMEEVVEASSASEPAVTEPIAAEPAVIEPAVSEPAAETPLAAVATEQPASEEHKDQKHEKAVWGEKFEAVYQELLLVKENNGTIEVEIKGRIRGGLRAIYKEMPLFLPASHFSLKRTPTEQELTDAAGKTMVVQVHELQEYDEGRKAVIVSRKHLLTEDFWTRISVGDIVEGKVSSIATFGVFVDLGGVEGLIHISRLSQVHVDDPNKFMKKGDTVKAVVVELDRTKNRIALSRKELEESPWKDVETLFLVGTQHTGIVRRLTDFGAYIELKPGVDGLLRTPEISWTKRIKKPSDVLKANSEIPVEILSVSEDKQTVSLSYKKTQPNPWHQLVDNILSVQNIRVLCRRLCLRAVSLQSMMKLTDLCRAVK